MAATGKKAPVTSKKTAKKGKKPVAARRKTRKTAGKGVFDGYIPGIYAETLGMTAANFALMRRAELRAKKTKSMKEMSQEDKNRMRSEEKKRKEKAAKQRVQQGQFLAAMMAARRKGQPVPRRSPFFVQTPVLPGLSGSNRSGPSASNRPGPAMPVTVPGGMVRVNRDTPVQPSLVVEAQDIIQPAAKKVINKERTLSKIAKATASGVEQKTRSKLVRINANLNGVLVGTMTISHGLPTSTSIDTSNMGKALGYKGKRAEYLKAIKNNLFANVAKAPGNFQESKTTYVIEAKFSDNLSTQMKKQVFGVMLKVAQAEAQLVRNPYMAVFKRVDGNAATAAANFAAKINNGGAGGMLFKIQ